MRTIKGTLTILALCGTALSAKASNEDQLHKAAHVLREIMRTPNKGIPQDLLRNSECLGMVLSEASGRSVNRPARRPSPIETRRHILTAGTPVATNHRFNVGVGLGGLSRSYEKLARPNFP